MSSATYQRAVFKRVLRFFFFFQAEDGIRDADVTGVQTCALPIWPRPSTITGGIESENLLLHCRTSSMTPRPGGSPMATAKRSTLEPIGFQRARYPGGDSLIFSKSSVGALISWCAM